MEEAGLTHDDLQKPINDPVFREELVRFWKEDEMPCEETSKEVVSSNPAWLRAREIMGCNFFGVEEAVQHFGVNPTRQQTLALSEIPFSEEVLHETKDTHILVAIFPLSILEIRQKVDSTLFYNQSWYDTESFAKERGGACWHLILKTPADNSTSKIWQEQLALVGKEDEVPTAHVMVYTIIGHYLATSERLFEHIYVRTSTVASHGYRVNVGFFDSKGLYVGHDWDGTRDGCLGVSSARKF